MSGLFGASANALRKREANAAAAAAKAAANAAKHAPGMGLAPSLPSNPAALAPLTREGFLAEGALAPPSRKGFFTLSGAMEAIGNSAARLVGAKGGRRRRHTKRRRGRKSTKRSRK